MKTYIISGCSYFQYAIQELLKDKQENIVYVNNYKNINNKISDAIRILIKIELSSIKRTSDLFYFIDYLASCNGKMKVGFIVSKYHSYLTIYIYKLFKGKVSFFYANNLTSFTKQITCWMKGLSYHPMRMIYCCSDKTYGLTLNELIILTISVTGKNISSIASVLGLSVSSTYRMRNSGAQKLGFDSYLSFCRAYVKNDVLLGHKRIVEIKGTLLVIK